METIVYIYHDIFLYCVISLANFRLLYHHVAWSTLALSLDVTSSWLWPLWYIWWSSAYIDMSVDTHRGTEGGRAEKFSIAKPAKALRRNPEGILYLLACTNWLFSHFDTVIFVTKVTVFGLSWKAHLWGDLWEPRDIYCTQTFAVFNTRYDARKQSFIRR